jgi:hypothetical protein
MRGTVKTIQTAVTSQRLRPGKPRHTKVAAVPIATNSRRWPGRTVRTTSARSDQRKNRT